MDNEASLANSWSPQLRTDTSWADACRVGSIQICAILVLFLFVAPATAQVAIVDRVLVRKSGPLHLNIHYPVTGIASIDHAVDLSGMAKLDPDDLQSATPEEPYSVSASYTVTRNDYQMFEVELSGNTYTGGAHGLPEFRSANFLMPDGWQVYLPELVDGPRGMAVVSRLAKEKLIEALGKKGELDSTTLESIQAVTTPAALNWTAFRWMPDALILTYAPYELLGYTGGPSIRIPMADIQAVVRDNPRAPSPSFDCSRARTEIEKALCGDVALARLDREMASRYMMAVGLYRHTNSDAHDPKYAADEQAQLTKLIAVQKAWETERDRVCAGGALACLTSSYKKRLKGSF